MAKCLYCGKEITGKSHNGKPLKYCNRECYNATRNSYNFGYAVCFCCGRTFKETRDRPNKFCSKSCSTIHSYKIKAIERAENEKVKPETLEEFNKIAIAFKDVCERIRTERMCS